MRKLNLSSRLLFFVLTLVALCFIYAPHAKSTTLSLYENCILGDDFADGVTETIMVTPVGKLCYEICERECNALSRKDGARETNGEEIVACKRDCKKGDLYKSPTQKDLNGNAVSIGSACSVDPQAHTHFYFPHDSRVVVNQGDDIVIKLKGTPNSFGGITMCGLQKRTLTPYYQGTTDDTEAAYDAMENHWNAIKHFLSSAPISWHARNYNATKTNIFFKDGDYLQIDITGDFRYYCNKPTKKCSPRPDDQSLLIRNPGLYNFALPFNGGNFTRLPSGDLRTYSRDSSGLILGFEAAYEANKDINWYGLYGKFASVYDDTLIDPDGEYTPDNLNIDTVGKKITTFQGVVDGFSTTYNNLGLMHFDAPPASNWEDNLGGLTVEITKAGCLFTDGDRLQYAITDELSGIDVDTAIELRYEKPVSSDWRDVPKSSSIEHLEFPSPKTGKIWLRVKPYSAAEDARHMPVCANSDDDCNEIINQMSNFYGPGDTNGHYLAEVRKIQSDSFGSSILSDTIRDIRSYFFGENGNGGVVQDMFNKFVSHSDLVLIIRVLLLLYITVTGASFMIGIAQITQREAVTRMMAIGLVVALLAPNSWEFFNTYLFQLFINGGLELMANVINYTEYGLPSDSFQRVKDDPALVFTALDKPLAIIFGAKTWMKIYALTLSSLVGFILAFAILYAGILYAVTLIKAMLIYVVSLIFMSILLLLAPVFISFVLFGYTRKMFTTWLQQLMSVTLQPVVIVAGLGIFSTLILVGLYTALGFTVCEGCLFSFYVPVFGLMDEPFCIWPAWFTLLSKHSPDGVIVPPLVTVGAAFYFLIMAQGAYVFTTDIVQRINQIISGFFLGVDLSGYANIADYTTSYTSAISSAPGFITGTDATGRQYRASLKRNFEGAVKHGVVNPVKSLGSGANKGFKSTSGVDVAESVSSAASSASHSTKKFLGMEARESFNVQEHLKNNPPAPNNPPAGGNNPAGGGGNPPAGGGGNDDGNNNDDNRRR